eukprot:CAMPEP_0172579782 /NCGR_PEP_ID=MMETSP1067-20121228/139425_1 /TAXON_ID=265564 ORGANISM="Thalassiosira punctigera, Strain Tpunct2005C2" /NCGR_SAMPLE_ID=MMETSP1067 /ASSEMBLY_ACC=CAM_ASM_000444 /LENGTH=266 /DNA_ID=CAMNT_0013372511 /DNA_START=357 /DNA_END=1158 /DNA_ORIENTATION=+
MTLELEPADLIELQGLKKYVVQTAHEIFRHVCERQIGIDPTSSFSINASKVEWIAQPFLPQPLYHRELRASFSRGRAFASTLLFDVHEIEGAHDHLPLLLVGDCLVLQPYPAAQAHPQQLRRLAEDAGRGAGRPVVPPVALPAAAAPEHLHVPLGIRQARRPVLDEHGVLLLVRMHAVNASVADDAPGEEGAGGQLHAVRAEEGGQRLFQEVGRGFGVEEVGAGRALLSKQKFVGRRYESPALPFAAIEHCYFATMSPFVLLFDCF